MFAGNNGCFPICKDCLNTLYYKYFEEYDKNHYEAMRRICMAWDIYYNDGVLYSSLSSSNKSNKPVVGSYVKNLNLKLAVKSKGATIGKTYDDTLHEENDNRISSDDDLKKVSDDTKLTEKSLKKWGFGFETDDYVFLDNQFADWKARVVIDGKARESLVRDLCVIKLHQQKAIKGNEIDLYNKLQKTYQDTLASANLKPIQEDANDKASEKPMGVMIGMFENDRPIPEPLPEWQDVDGIMKLVTVYFIGHLCKMLGLKNKYAKMYEDEMQKYRVEVPELEELDDEDVFDFLINNTDNVKLTGEVGEDIE